MRERECVRMCVCVHACALENGGGDNFLIFCRGRLRIQSYATDSIRFIIQVYKIRSSQFSIENSDCNDTQIMVIKVNINQPCYLLVIRNVRYICGIAYFQMRHNVRSSLGDPIKTNIILFGIRFTVCNVHMLLYFLILYHTTSDLNINPNKIMY